MAATTKVKWLKFRYMSFATARGAEPPLNHLVRVFLQTIRWPMSKDQLNVTGSEGVGCSVRLMMDRSKNFDAIFITK